MNTKTLAIAAALLVATSGLASARTANHQVRTNGYQNEQSFKGAFNSAAGGNAVTVRYPGDNDMDGNYTK